MSLNPLGTPVNPLGTPVNPLGPLLNPLGPLLNPLGPLNAIGAYDAILFKHDLFFAPQLRSLEFVSKINFLP